MNLKKFEFTIQGIAPLMMHNGQLANPLNKWAKAMKSITKKGKKKTDEDLEELARLEFYGGIYVDADGDPCIPAANIEGCFVSGAKKQRLGDDFKAGLFCEKDWKLIYKGPKTVDELWANESFRDVRKAVLNGKVSVMRCRPYFSDWSLRFEVLVNPKRIDDAQVRETLVLAGEEGLCDHTPKFGRFEVL